MKYHSETSGNIDAENGSASNRKNEARLLNVTKCAELLGVPRSTIYYWSSRHEIPIIKVGRHVRFDREQVLAFFKEKSQPRPPCKISNKKLSSVTDISSLKIRFDRPVVPLRKE